MATAVLCRKDRRTYSASRVAICFCGDIGRWVCRGLGAWSRRRCSRNAFELHPDWSHLRARFCSDLWKPTLWWRQHFCAATFKPQSFRCNSCRRLSGDLGDVVCGGDSSAVQDQLRNVKEISAYPRCLWRLSF